MAGLQHILIVTADYSAAQRFSSIATFVASSVRVPLTPF